MKNLENERENNFAVYLAIGITLAMCLAVIVLGLYGILKTGL